MISLIRFPLPDFNFNNLSYTKYILPEGSFEEEYIKLKNGTIPAMCRILWAKHCKNMNNVFKRKVLSIIMDRAEDLRIAQMWRLDQHGEKAIRFSQSFFRIDKKKCIVQNSYSITFE